MLLRTAALLLLAALVPLSAAELSELRGELAFTRFWRLHRMLRAMEEVPDPGSSTALARTAATEADLVMRFARGNPEALRLLSVACLQWAGGQAGTPLIRLQMAERGVSASALAVVAAPSDYELWLGLARACASLGMWGQADTFLTRARELAPPGRALTLTSAER